MAIKLLRILTRKDQDGVRARKVKAITIILQVVALNRTFCVFQRLNREVYVWHRLEHPNVVKLFGTSYHMSGRPAMVMRWYDNGNAAEYLANKNPGADRKQLVTISGSSTFFKFLFCSFLYVSDQILDVARGLAYLHTHKPPIIHADLKGVRAFSFRTFLSLSSQVSADWRPVLEQRAHYG